MMQVKENLDSTKDDGNQKSEALKTEEILSLLSKQNSDFQKESEILPNCLHNVSIGLKIGTSTASSAIMTRSGARCLWTSIRRPCGFSESLHSIRINKQSDK